MGVGIEPTRWPWPPGCLRKAVHAWQCTGMIVQVIAIPAKEPTIFTSGYSMPALDGKQRQTDKDDYAGVSTPFLIILRNATFVLSFLITTQYGSTVACHISVLDIFMKLVVQTDSLLLSISSVQQ
jgi:hypothetical protein